MLLLMLKEPINAKISASIMRQGLKIVQLSQSFKSVGYGGCASCWGDVGAGDAEADVIYITFIVSVQYLV